MSTDDLGLDELTDDQLVELARSVAREIARRDPVTQDEADKAILSERDRMLAYRSGGVLAKAAERDRLRREAAALAQAEVKQQARVAEAALEAERVARQHRPRVTLAAMIADGLGGGWTATSWQRDREVRIYLDGPGCTWDQKSGPHAVYYVTGNAKHPPGKLVTRKIEVPRKIVHVIARILAERLTGRLVCDDELAGGIAPDALPEAYLEIRHAVT